MSPDKRRHRGAHPEDARLFASERIESLRIATSESALKLVGDRHNLRERQRLAVGRAACSDEARAVRLAREVGPRAIEGAELIVDGFNLVITLEAALGGGALVLCRDGCMRDLSSVHGSYRAVEETERAVSLAGEVLAALRPASVLWLLDSPVSNSGRLAERVRAVAASRGWLWEVEVDFNPDRRIADSERVAVTSDSNVLDHTARRLNLSRLIVERHTPDAWLIDLNVP